MESTNETGALSQVDADLLLVGIFQDEKVGELLKELDPSAPELFIKNISDECTRENFTGKTGQSLQLPTFGAIKSRKFALRGLGNRTEFDATIVRKASAGAKRSAQMSESVALDLRVEDQPSLVQALVEGWILAGYKFSKYKTKDDDNKRKETKTLRILGATLEPAAFDSAVARANTIADATNFARDLIAEPAAYMTPTRLAEAAGTIANDGVVKVDILDMKDAEELGMGAFLGVARGAKEPAKFIVLRYTHAEAKKTIGLAGKGITFDSGGLSIKTSQGMENMKYDMSGAAAVIATIRAIAVLRPKVNVIAVAAATENMPGGAAMHPGDVLTAMNGKTIEVNNTDAEGRLVLADALSYLCKEKPDEVIDLATLTGAVVTALGRAAAGIMGNDDNLIKRISAAGALAGERYWQLPMYDDYKDSLKSDIADLKNAGARGEAASAAAAMFLKEFVTTPWAHLDIAGPAWLDKDKDELNKGGTAFGVRTLCYYLLSQGEL